MNILVTGASGQIGQFLLPQLVQHGYTVVCVSRHKQSADMAKIYWLEGDLTNSMETVWQENKASVWIHLAFLPLALTHLEAAGKAGIKRFIGFSSTSIFTKNESENNHEQKMIRQLVEAEKKLLSDAPQHDITWTLFRPTMIYGCGMDQNIAFIQRMIGRFGVFPVAGKAKGLRQPVHAEDLGLACVEAIGNTHTANKAYNLSGAEVLSYREMVERIFCSLNRPVRMIGIHPVIYKCAISMMKRMLPRYAFVHTSMVDRMNMDMVFDHSDAIHDFGYNPRSFQP